MSRLELEGANARLKMKNMELITRANTKISGIKHALATSAITPLAEIEARAVKLMAEELFDLQLEHKELLVQLREIEKELNG